MYHRPPTPDHSPYYSVENRGLAAKRWLIDIDRAATWTQTDSAEMALLSRLRGRVLTELWRVPLTHEEAALDRTPDALSPGERQLRHVTVFRNAIRKLESLKHDQRRRYGRWRLSADDAYRAAKTAAHIAHKWRLVA